MRTTLLAAALPHPKHWHAGFASARRAQTWSPVVWQHVFLSDKPMPNWHSASRLVLSWADDKVRLERRAALYFPWVVSNS
jgi:hypothetical protein